MSMNDTEFQRLIAKLQKLLNLAEQGVGGEADNAARMLDRLLSKHGLSIEQLRGQDQKPSAVVLPHKGGHDRELLFNILYAVTNANSVAYRRIERRNAIEVDLTPAQHAEVLMSYAVYSPALKEHMEIAYTAFVLRNGIFPDTPSPQDTDDASSDPACDAQLVAMLRATKQHQVRPGIEHRDSREEA